ncbi:hypothetical protein HYW53_00635 [Candidatus Giovannonibacteria bacterium]|nr:hypothetical protein [Candidatus Giovannonibacteria bacterium]
MFRVIMLASFFFLFFETGAAGVAGAAEKINPIFSGRAPEAFRRQFASIFFILAKEEKFEETALIRFFTIKRHIIVIVEIGDQRETVFSSVVYPEEEVPAGIIAAALAATFVNDYYASKKRTARKNGPFDLCAIFKFFLNRAII